MRSCVTISLVPEARGGPFVFWDDLPGACRTASELGFDAVEIFTPSADAIDADALATLLDDCGLKLAALGTGAGWVLHKLQLSDADAAHRQQASDFVRSIIDAAGRFGASAIIGSMQGKCETTAGRADALAWLAESLEPLGEHAARYNVPLLFEPVNRYETNLVNQLSQGATLLDSLSTNNIKLLGDLFHMNIEEVDVAAALAAARQHLGHVHFVDTNRRAAGFGHFDYAPIVAALQEIEYDGYLSAEALPLPTPAEAARQTITTYKTLLS